MTTNELKITFGQAADHRREARKRLERAEAGETGDAIAQEECFILNVEDFRDVERLMRLSNLTLLETIVDEQPESIRATADAVGRDYREVHRNLEDLEDLGVIEFHEDNGRKPPILRGGADAVDISLHIDNRNEDTTAAAP